MFKPLNRIIGSNWFFLSLLGFAVLLPLSQALVSIFAGVVLFTALVEDSWQNKIQRLRQNKILLLIPAVYLIYLSSAVLSGQLTHSLYDLKKNLFFLVIPVAIIFGKEISAAQKRLLLYSFSSSVFISTIIAFVNWKLTSSQGNFEVHRISLISHIRFSFQLLLAFWFMLLSLRENYPNLKWNQRLLLAGFAVYFISFLLFQQSLTGLIAFMTSSVFYIIYVIFQTSFKKRIIYFSLLVLLLAIPAAYVSWIIIKFYNIEDINRQTLDKTTKTGNVYYHDFQNPMVENGHYVYLYINEKETRQEWNKISEFKYDSIGKNGYTIRSTLFRYLTSKGLRKDAEGVHALTRQDVANVENGIANVIYQKKFSLYPRIYQTVWEYYIYSKTGYANHQSFSQRLEFAKAAITIIKQHPWFGVGTANWKEAFRNAYVANNSRLDESLYASSHNQYLNYMVKFGIIGFLLVMVLLIYPVIRTRRYHDLFFAVFLVYMFFVNFADSNFESHMGSSFFVFFYCLFLIGDGIHYLRLKPNTK